MFFLYIIDIVKKLVDLPYRLQINVRNNIDAKVFINYHPHSSKI